MSKPSTQELYSSSAEHEVRATFVQQFRACPIPDEDLLQNLGLFISSKNMARILFMDHIYRLNVPVHGTVMEFGTRWGQNLALFAAFRGIYEPFNRMRKIVGFDTFEGFPNLDAVKDNLGCKFMHEGGLACTPGYDEYLRQIMQLQEADNPMSHVKKYDVIKGDASVTVEKYFQDFPETMVSLAFFDFDIFKPTLDCLRAIKGRVTKGSVIAFDELSDRDSPGETLALNEVWGLKRSNSTVTVCQPSVLLHRGVGMKLGLPEFLQLVGETSLTDGVADHLLHANLSYRPLSLQERDKVILDIGYDVQRMKPIGDLSRWEKGWGELLVTYLATNDEISLNPQYVHPGRVCRVFRDYVMPRSQTFEADFFEVFRFWLFETFLKEFEAVYEFGCGSCYNLPVLARMYPNKKIVGLDWSYASVAIGLLLGKKYPNVTANHFDMLVSQPHDPTVPSNSVAVTIGGMEQLGERFDTFVLYLARTFKLCVHVEPIVEWYQGEELPDSLAKAFHYQRRYLRGFPAYLDKLVAEGKAEIVKSHRIEFGSLYHDYGSAIVWRPVRQE